MLCDVFIILLLLVAMVCAGFFGNKTVMVWLFRCPVILGLYWLNHHATDPHRSYCKDSA
ncbi:DUF5993 family protein [Vibrio lentus]|nr:DUF5993 family protein [Vibrio lentus]